MNWQDIVKMRERADAARVYQEKLDDQSKRIAQGDLTAVADLLFSVRRVSVPSDAEWDSVPWEEFSRYTKSLKYSYWIKASKLVQEMWEAGVARDQIGNAILVAARYI